ncbi:MAG: DUF501 domain-containing protein [Nocardioidaceae bacterium]
MSGSLSGADAEAVEVQLGRPPRDCVGVTHRCPCGCPDVVSTAPRLGDGSPFPTFYYLTCPRAVSAVGTLEAGGLMRDMSQRLVDDERLAERYADAHRAYVAARTQHGDVPEIDDVSAGGMPDRVKCLHALVAQALAAGPGVNPLGDEALAQLPRWWANGPCVGPSAEGGVEPRP